MENRQLTDEQPNEAEGHAIVHEPRYWLITALAVVATALLVGGGMWWWMNGKLEAQRQGFEQARNSMAQLEQQGDQEKIESEEFDNKENWPIFKSALYGYKINYPRGWVVDFWGHEALNLYDENIDIHPYPAGGLSAVGNSLTIEIRNILLSDFINEYAEIEIESQEDYILAGRPAKKFSATTSNGIKFNYIFYRDTEWRSFIIQYSDENSTLNSILSTFAFIDVEEISSEDWKTYQSDEFGFSFLHPHDWYAYQATDFGRADRSEVLLAPIENLIPPDGTEWGAIGKHIWVVKQVLPEGTSHEEWAADQESGEFLNEESAPDGGVRVYRSNNTPLVYYLFHGNEVLEFSTVFSSAEGLLLEIIKTVRFAN